MLSPKFRSAYLYWHGAESLHGGLPNTALYQILRMVNMLPKLIQGRLDFLGELSPSLAEHAKKTGRIPSNLPIVVTPKIEKMWCSNEAFSAGIRNFNISGTTPYIKWRSVAPLPLHIDVGFEDLYKILPPLQYKSKSEVKDELGFF